MLFVASKMLNNETSRKKTKYPYIKSSDIQGLLSDSIVITLICGFFFFSNKHENLSNYLAFHYYKNWFP